MQEPYDYERALKFLQGSAKFDPVYAAMAAVEKQIEKPVVYINRIPHCPSCNQEIKIELTIKYDVKHCPVCGQAFKNKNG